MIAISESALFNTIANRQFSVPSSSTTSNYVDLQTGIEISHCKSLKNWQARIVNELYTTNNDVYITTPPGGGKTLPLVCHWTNTILGLNTIFEPGKNLIEILKSIVDIFERPDAVKNNKLAIAVPIRQLCELTAKDFNIHFIDIFIQSFMFIFNKIDNTLFANMASPDLNTNMSFQQGQILIKQTISHIFNILQTPRNWKYNNSDGYRLAKELYETWIMRFEKITNDSNQRINSRNIDIQNIVNNISRFVNQINNNTVFNLPNMAFFEILNPNTLHGISRAINTIEQVFPLINDNMSIPDQQKEIYVNTLNSFYKHLINTRTKITESIQQDNEKITRLYAGVFKELANSYIYLKTGINETTEVNKADCGVIICIYENSPTVLFDISSKIHTFVIDESHMIQGSTSDRSVEDARKKCNSLFNAFDNLEKRTKLVFLSGTIHPLAANELKKFLKLEYYRTLSILDDGGDGRNASQISVVGDGTISNIQNLKKIILDTNQHGSLIIMFNKDRINELARACISGSNPTSLKGVTSGNLSKTQFSSNRAKFPGSITDKNNIDFKNIKKYASPGESAEDIYDDFQRQCVMVGFGFIYRPDNNDPFGAQKNNDAIIVANLFSQGKLRAVIATDSVGVGVNLAVQNLYIPAIDKFNGVKIANVPKHSLAQVLHRVGRSAFKVSRIITLPESVPVVLDALHSSRDKFEQKLLVLPMNRVGRYEKSEALFQLLQAFGFGD